MPNINAGIVCAIIEKARIFHAKEGLSFPEKWDGTDDEADYLQILADHASDLTYLEIKTVINQLEPDQKNDLVALMYLGRGDFSPKEWHAALTMAKQLQSDHVAEYLLSKPQVSDFLQEGLNLLGYSCEEWEQNEQPYLG